MGRPKILIAVALAAAAILFIVVVRQARLESPERTPSIYRPQMVSVAPGHFMMGSPDAGLSSSNSEGQGPVRITRAFAIARTEVTQSQWAALMGYNPSWFDSARNGGPTHPVERVSWYDAVAYLNALSEREHLRPCYQLDSCSGRIDSACPHDKPMCAGSYQCSRVRRNADCNGYRLPTEAEWEYAARAGTSAVVYAGSLEREDLDPIAWHHELRTEVGCALSSGEPAKGECGTRAVASGLANAWGLHDVIGNVAEWVEDDFVADDNLDRRGHVEDPQRLEGTSQYAHNRGCSIYSERDQCRVGARTQSPRTSRYSNLGVRPARSM